MSLYFLIPLSISQWQRGRCKIARQNNVARSLIIASKLQGWDPTKIEGSDFAGNDYPEDRVTRGDTPYLTGPLPDSAENRTPDPGVPGADSRSPGSGGTSSGKHNPYGGGKSEAGA